MIVIEYGVRLDSTHSWKVTSWKVTLDLPFRFTNYQEKNVMYQ